MKLEKRVRTTAKSSNASIFELLEIKKSSDAGAFQFGSLSVKQCEMDTPVISVLLPVFNGELHLSEAVASLKAQSETCFEVILLDDASTDSTLELCHSYAQSDSRFRVVTHSTNEGLVAMLNHGIALAQGEFVARMDHDDVSLSERFKLQLDYLQAHSELDMVGCFVETFGDAAQERVVEYPRSVGETLFEMFFACCVAHPSVMIRRAALQRLDCGENIYQSEFKHSEDYALWLRMIQADLRMSNIPQVLLRYRQHSNSISSRHAAVQHSAKRTLISRALKECGCDIGDAVECWIDPQQQHSIEHFQRVTDCLQKLVQHLKHRFASNAVQLQEAYERRLGLVAAAALAQHSISAMSIWRLWLNTKPADLSAILGALQAPAPARPKARKETQANKLCVIVFSKDRSFQLRECLRCLHLFLHCTFEVHVIYTVSSEFASSYDQIRADFSSVTFHSESDQNFSRSLSSIVDSTRAPWLMFMVDDALLYADVDFTQIESAFSRNKLIGFYLRMNEALRHCQPAGKDMDVPKFVRDDNVLVWNRLDGELDWNYPFDVSGTIYTTTRVRATLKSIEEQFGEEGTCVHVACFNLRSAFAAEQTRS
jgi:GT2 family glycosyltransferase